MRLFSKKTPSCGAVIVAAGTASRMKGTDKILAPLGGVPAIVHTIAAFQQTEEITELVVVTRLDLIAPVTELCRSHGLTKVTKIVPGGASRPESVSLGLDCLSGRVELAAIHDGARPLVTPQIIANTVRAAVRFHAAAPAVPVKDTIKLAENHIVTETPDRSRLFAIQTPQVFSFDLLRAALQKAMEEELPITDDCSAVEAMGMSVYLTEGSDENIKLTTPIDLVVAEAIWSSRREQP